MFQLQSERLILTALSLSQLELLARSRDQLERSMGLDISNLHLSADDAFMQEFATVIPGYIIPQVKQHAGSYLWYTHWLIISAAKNMTIGGIGCSGLPGANGEVMIGYFIDQRHEGRGYATEAVRCLAKWMLHHPALTSVIADTPVDHIASQKVLQKAGFLSAGAVEEGLRWRLPR